MIHEAVIPFRVGPARIVLADANEPLEPVPVPRRPTASQRSGTPQDATNKDDTADREERERLASVLGRLLELAGELRAAQRQRLEEMQRVAVELAAAVAGQLVFDQLEAGQYPIEELVRSAVQRLEPRQPVTVYLHPEDLALLGRRTAEEPLVALDAGDLRLQPDPALSRGSCRAETGDVAILTNLQEHLADIRRDLMQALPAAEVERRKATGESSLRRYPERRATA